MRFADWLRKDEVLTSTADIARFPGHILGSRVSSDGRKKKRRRITEAADFDQIPDDVIKVDLPHVQQTTIFSCGAAVVHSLCSFFGVGSDDQEEYMKTLHSHPEKGTSPERIISYIKAKGLKVIAKEGMTLDDIKVFLDQGKPVICCLQAYGKVTDYENKDISGHYVVAIGYDKKKMIFQDPSSGAWRTFLPFAEFDKRWHDESAKKKLDHYGIVVWKRGKSPYRHKAKFMEAAGI